MLFKYVGFVLVFRNLICDCVVSFLLSSEEGIYSRSSDAFRKLSRRGLAKFEWICGLGNPWSAFCMTTKGLSCF